MDFYMYHGRIAPDAPPQRLDEDGTAHAVDDWGFDGPRLSGVIGFHCTYGTSGHWNLYFESKEATDVAQGITGWERWDEDALTVDFSPDNDMVCIRDLTYNRPHYFGDWGIK